MRENVAAALFGGGIAWILYCYVGYPTVLLILACFRRKCLVCDEAYAPHVSVLIAARNEERDIGWKIAETLAWDYPSDRVEILVASDASNDRTDEIVRACRDQRVRLVRLEKRGGKQRCLNRIVPEASGDILFFTDANAHIGPACLKRMVRHFADGQVGCVTGVTRPVLTAESAAIGNGASVFLSFEGMLNSLESLLGSVMVCDGAIFCIRKGLFSPLTPTIANDLELPMLVRHAGFLNLYEPDGIVTERDTSSLTEELARRRRISGQGMVGMWELRHTLTGLRGWQFVSHKLMRYLTLIPLLLMFAGTLGAPRTPFWNALLVLQVLTYCLAIGVALLTARGYVVGRLLSLPFYVVFGCIGAVIGIADWARGKRYDIWETAMLSRGPARG
jgi:cellulose synthase/poly-beta-1,6-N-acetylglucosamine synthase-like glycosyltransferase